MLHASPASIVILVLLRGAPTAQPPTAAACVDVQRVELSRSPATMSREICVSPGLMTGFLFDAPVVVDLQDEVRFEEVTRGRSSFSFVPPRDMMPGERLRLTVQFTGGAVQESVTFTLVAHSGEAVHQVEVYRDQRTRESYQREIEQERVKNQRLQEENRQLRVQLEQAGGLLGLYVSDALGWMGVRCRDVAVNRAGNADGIIFATNVLSCRSKRSVAVEVRVKNATAEPWTAAGASLVTAKGEKMVGLKLWQAEAIAPHTEGDVFVEVDAPLGEPKGEVTVNLWETGPRSIVIPQVRFP